MASLSNPGQRQPHRCRTRPNAALAAETVQRYDNLVALIQNPR